MYGEAAVSVNTRPYPEVSGCKTKPVGFVWQYNDVFVGRGVDDDMPNNRFKIYSRKYLTKSEPL